MREVGYWRIYGREPRSILGFPTRFNTDPEEIARPFGVVTASIISIHLD
jgi:hypothetical protein